MSLREFLAVMAIGAAIGSALASEKKVSMKDLPEPVRKTVQEQMKGATLKGLAKEVEEGKTQYEAELAVNGRTRDVIIDPDGRVAIVEEEVALASLPPAVKSAFEQLAGKRKILLVESIMEHGAIVAYEAQIRSGSKVTEVKVSPDGKPMK